MNYITLGAVDAAADAIDTTTSAVQTAYRSVLPSFLHDYADSAISIAISVIICLIVAKLVLSVGSKTLERVNIELTLKKFIKSIIRVVVYFILFLVIAGKLGFNTSSIVALASVLSAAFALAAQGALSNLFGGVLLLITKPFLVGDYVSAGGIEGTVLEIGLLNTQINTFDNKRVSVPNGTISSATITNYSTEDKRRMDILVPVSYKATVEQVRQTLMEAIAATEGILSEPAEPMVRVNTYNVTSMEYVVRVWAPTADYWPIYFNLMDNIKICCDKNGMEFPYSHMNVHMMES